MDITRLVAELRAQGGDSTAVEVKRASGGLPGSLTETLSALANLPGGGIVILGLDEANGFRPVELADPNKLRQGLAQKARSLEPPVQLAFEEGAEIEGRPIVVATVLECDPSAKPCRVASSGRAYSRGYDGDFELSAVEVQGFLAQRSQPVFDQQPVKGSTRDDLDEALVGSWVSTAQEQAPYGIGRFGQDEMLVHGGVLARDGRPTKGGLLALGRYPQQWFPRYVIHAAVEPVSGGSRTRAQEVTTIDGAIPRMLEGALAWARRNFARETVEADDGRVLERFAFPLAALRELISNALVHRDLDAWSEGRAVDLRYSRERLVVTSPGGLWGITVDRLGSEGVTSARNGQLLSICQHVRSDDGEGRVVEALAQGLPRVHALLAEIGAPRPRYVDRGLSFTVIGSVAARHEQAFSASAVIALPPTEQRVFDVLDDKWRTVAEICEATDLRPANARRVLRGLRSRALTEVDGGPGRATFYRRRPGT